MGKFLIKRMIPVMAAAITAAALAGCTVSNTEHGKDTASDTEAYSEPAKQEIGKGTAAYTSPVDPTGDTEPVTDAGDAPVEGPETGAQTDTTVETVKSTEAETTAGTEPETVYQTQDEYVPNDYGKLYDEVLLKQYDQIKDKNHDQLTGADLLAKTLVESIGKDFVLKMTYKQQGTYAQGDDFVVAHANGSTIQVITDDTGDSVISGNVGRYYIDHSRIKGQTDHAGEYSLKAGQDLLASLYEALKTQEITVSASGDVDRFTMKNGDVLTISYDADEYFESIITPIAKSIGVGS